jgi:hypothetical protein
MSLRKSNAFLVKTKSTIRGVELEKACLIRGWPSFGVLTTLFQATKNQANCLNFNSLGFVANYLGVERRGRLLAAGLATFG